MINWNKVEKDILTKLNNALHEIDPDSAELKMGYGTLLATGKEIKNYIKFLIEKEFKLVARGKVKFKQSISLDDYEEFIDDILLDDKSLKLILDELYAKCESELIEGEDISIYKGGEG